MKCLQLRHLPQALLEEGQHTRDPFPLPGLDHGRGTERQESHQGAHLEPRGAAVRQHQDVVVEAVLLIPHALVAGAIHAGGDPQEMIDELLRHGLVRRVVGSELDRQLAHVLTE